MCETLAKLKKKYFLSNLVFTLIQKFIFHPHTTVGTKSITSTKIITILPVMVNFMSQKILFYVYSSFKIELCNFLNKIFKEKTKKYFLRKYIF